jgi:hypothetical protein
VVRLVTALMILPACLVILVFSNGSAYFSIRMLISAQYLMCGTHVKPLIKSIFQVLSLFSFSKVALTFSLISPEHVSYHLGSCLLFYKLFQMGSIFFGVFFIFFLLAQVMYNCIYFSAIIVYSLTPSLNGNWQTSLVLHQ